jgi:iron complex transport system substrate-binding protein
MRVVTLLPAATEIVAALGGADQLVGISHECDYPASVLGLPRVTATSIDSSSSSADIDDQVERLRAAGTPVIGIEAEQLRRLAPDLIITQELCEVCAVADGEAHRLARAMVSPPRVLSLEGRTLAGIWSDIHQIGRALGLDDEADELVLGLQSRLARMGSSSPASRPRALCIEWLDPLFLAGHWVPELVHAAGGEDIGARSGDHSKRREWAQLETLRPDHFVVMLCGFGVDRARAELDRLDDPVALSVLATAPVWVIDGNAYTSRPGPRVVDGASRLQFALRGCERDGVERWRPS